jgi:pyrroline-5-carboxylate reductase
MKLSFIGGGNMGEAIIAALLEKKRAIPTGITVSDVSPARLDYLAGKYGVLTRAENLDAIAGAEIIVLSVKPQQFPEVAKDIKGQLGNGQLVISIMAGVGIGKLVEALGYGTIVRAMPNTPAQIGYGISGWTATPAVTEVQKGQAKIILGAMGREIYFEDEKHLDMVTAVSGSGPAYCFLFAEALTEAAVSIGLPKGIGERLVLQTMLGSAHLWENSTKPAAELRRAVTSKGGTTERALEVFEKGGFVELVREAVRAAYRRAEELGNQ